MILRPVDLRVNTKDLWMEKKLMMPDETPKNLKVNPDLHRRLRVHIAQMGGGMQDFVEQVLERELGSTPAPNLTTGLTAPNKQLLEQVAELLRTGRSQRAIRAIRDIMALIED